MTCNCNAPCNCNNASAGTGTPIGAGAGSAACTGTSWTVADVQSLEQAIATGATTVKYRDHQVSYRSLDDMIKTLNLMRAAVCGPSAGAAATGGRRFSFARTTDSCGGSTSFRGCGY